MSVITKTVSKLNSQQLEAVRHREGPLLILAGAGSGKTAGMIPLSGEGTNTILKQALITGAFFTTGTVVAIDAFRGDGFKSRSGF